ncbi:hypothetical protein [Paenibacillus sp. MMS20-IR301]|uniref:hypothetical protein n=1 Tax=Paenibacillus sp. MMS20-IR301 TaxID=2895946 RepID=UPI0037C737D2
MHGISAGNDVAPRFFNRNNRAFEHCSTILHRRKRRIRHYARTGIGNLRTHSQQGHEDKQGTQAYEAGTPESPYRSYHNHAPLPPDE